MGFPPDFPTKSWTLNLESAASIDLIYLPLESSMVPQRKGNEECGDVTFDLNRNIGLGSSALPGFRGSMLNICSVLHPTGAENAIICFIFKQPGKCLFSRALKACLLSLP